MFITDIHVMNFYFLNIWTEGGKGWIFSSIQKSLLMVGLAMVC
jgi:hypothetical protein